MTDALEKIRKIRTEEGKTLKPSPYLRDRYVDEWEVEQPVSIRNYQRQGIMNLLQVENMVLGDDTGLGKAQPVDSLVLTPDGWVQIGSLRIGDKVVGSDGKPTKVVGIFPQGRKNTYEIIMSDGFSTKCCDEHLWTVRTGNSRRFGDGWHTLSLKDIRNSGLLRQKNSNGLRYSIPIVSPVKFEEKKLPIDPYLLGVLLGDGSFSNSITICSGDEEIFSLVKERLPKNYTLNQVKGDKYSKRISSNRPGVRSDLLSSTKELGLFRSNWYTKFIPNVYLFSSINQRIELLQGLMDTDGYISKDGHVTQFYSSSLSLVNDVTNLIQSLGGTAKIKKKKPVLGEKSKAKNAKMSYIIIISLPNEIMPFKISRKVKRWKPRSKYLPSRQIKEIKKNPVKEECVCIKVEAEDQLYVTDNFIVTHNTLQVLSAVGYVWMNEPEYVPIVVTRKSSLYQWANEVSKFMTNMEAVVVDSSPFERDGIYNDFFLNQNQDKKRLLITTYDILFKDMEESVVRDRTAPVTKKEKEEARKVKKKLVAARKAAKALKDEFETLKTVFKEHFDGRSYDVHLYVQDVLKPPDNTEPKKPPSDWSNDDERVLTSVVRTRNALREAAALVVEMNDLVAPPVVIPGILKYVQEMKNTRPGSKIMFIMDEVHWLKNYQGKMHKSLGQLAEISDRRIGMTATPVKNRLMEFFALFRIIQPKLFPKVTYFHNEYCITKLQPIGGGRKVPVVVGHSKKQLEKFVEAVEPYYLSRKKHDVAKELPQMITREIICNLTSEQEELYELAELGLLESGLDPDSEQADILKGMTMVQQACNAPQLLMDEEGNPFEGESSKIQALIEIFTEDFVGVKTIVFSRFEKMISILGKTLDEKKVNYVRVTGKEAKAKDRAAAMKQFQDPDSGIDVILITLAGGESINLHAAEHIVYIDSPWSWGDYVQINGRAIRIGSKNKNVLVTHLIARRASGAKTIDDYVIKKLRQKKVLADTVAGESLKDGLKFVQSNDTVDIFSMMVDSRLNDKKTVTSPTKKIQSTSSKKVQKKTIELNVEAAPNVPSAKLVELDFSDI